MYRKSVTVYHWKSHFTTTKKNASASGKPLGTAASGATAAGEREGRGSPGACSARSGGKATPIGSCLRAAPDKFEALQLEPRILTESGHTPAAAEHPCEDTAGRTVINATHGTPMPLCPGGRRQRQQFLDIRRCLAPSAKD